DRPLRLFTTADVQPKSPERQLQDFISRDAAGAGGFPPTGRFFQPHIQDIVPALTRSSMAWVHVGPHKINTALVCYVEQEGDTVRLYFHGEWEGNPLDLHFDEAKLFWKHLKAENVLIGRDKGSAAVVPRTFGDKMVDLPPADKGAALKSGPASSSSLTGSSSGSHS